MAGVVVVSVWLQAEGPFAGEHTCYAFTGYMAGALQSGFGLPNWLDETD